MSRKRLENDDGVISEMYEKSKHNIHDIGYTIILSGLTSEG